MHHLKRESLNVADAHMSMPRIPSNILPFDCTHHGPSISLAHQIRSVDFSPSCDRLLVCGSSTQPAILDRDGRRLTSLMKGDMYIRDMRHTKGHVAACTTGKWHPSDHNVIATASEDGTVSNANPCDPLVLLRDVTFNLDRPIYSFLALVTRCSSVFGTSR